MNAKINEENYRSERKMYFVFFMFVCLTVIYINKQRGRFPIDGFEYKGICYKVDVFLYGFEWCHSL